MRNVRAGDSENIGVRIAFQVHEKEFFQGWKDEPFEYRVAECEYDFSFGTDAGAVAAIA